MSENYVKCDSCNRVHRLGYCHKVSFREERGSVERLDDLISAARIDERAKTLADVLALGDECFATCKTPADHWVCCEDFWIRLQTLADKR